MVDVIKREIDNHEFDNCGYHRDEFFCDCERCEKCNIMRPPELLVRCKEWGNKTTICWDCEVK